jgi:DNA-directed RNA polymerase specialized sigma24 family protein
MRINKKEIISEIKLNNEAVLTVLAKKYFPSARRIIRMNGLKDRETPEVFSEVLAHIYLAIQQEHIPHNIDFEDYFFTTLHEWIDKIKDERKTKDKLKFSDLVSDRNKVAADCVSILDEQSQQVIYARVTEQLSYEKIAERFRFTSAVIAQQEFNKAYNQLESIVKVRMNISLN